MEIGETMFFSVQKTQGAFLVISGQVGIDSL